jgi:hypothetical protein
MQKAERGWGVDRLEVECQNCGARISVSAEELSLACAFCGSNKVIQNQNPQDIFRPRFLIPFRIDSKTCKEIVQKWLGSNWMTPTVLKRLINIWNFSEIFIPYWTFDSQTSANWEAEVGHPETEHYYDHSDKTWKTRTRINWRWESGNVQLKFDDLIEAGTSRLSPKHLVSVRNYNLQGLVAYDPVFLAGIKAQTYDIPLKSAWETARQEMREKTRQACRKQASTPMIRNFRMELDFNDENWRLILLPLFLASYTYGERIYQVLINGQTGTISGQRPVDWMKVWSVIAALLAPGVLLGFLGLVMLPLAGVGAPIGGVGLFLLLVGVVVGIIILVKANQLDDA